LLIGSWHISPRLAKKIHLVAHRHISSTALGTIRRFYFPDAVQTVPKMIASTAKARLDSPERQR